MKNLKRRNIVFTVFISFLLVCPLSAICSETSTGALPADTVDIQVLYNGKAWRNLHYKIQGDQFLFNSGFIPGSVTIRGRTFEKQSVRYDCYNDELLMLTAKGIILQLNKEIVDGFTLEYNNRVFAFRNFKSDSARFFTGYVNVLSEGSASLFAKYSKEVMILAVENKYDLFTDNIRIYAEKDGITSKIGSKADLLRFVGERKQQVRDFIKSNGIRISKKNPETIRPVIDYYNSLQKSIPE